MEKKTDSDYTAKYSKKRKGVKVTLEFYQDDIEEKMIYELLKNEPRGGMKVLILQLLSDHYLGLNKNEH